MIEVPTGSISGMVYPMPAGSGGDDPEPKSKIYDQPVEEDENTQDEEDNE